MESIFCFEQDRDKLKLFEKAFLSRVHTQGALLCLIYKELISFLIHALYYRRVFVLWGLLIEVSLGPSGCESSSLEASYDLLEIARSHLKPSSVGQAGDQLGKYGLRTKQRETIKQEE